jgi:hypothetical protein
MDKYLRKYKSHSDYFLKYLNSIALARGNFIYYVRGLGVRKEFFLILYSSIYDACDCFENKVTIFLCKIETQTPEYILSVWSE